MTDASPDSKDPLIQFCPTCGVRIIGDTDVRFCMSCGTYLIPFIPKDRIQEWLGIHLTPDEIEELYRSAPPQSRATTPPMPVMYTYSYRNRRPWKIGAALGVPLLAVIAKIIISLVIAFIYILIVVEDYELVDIDAFLNAHIIPITIIELITQVLFLIIPFLFTAVFFPYKAPRKERWESLGIPFGLKIKQIVKEVGIGIGFAILMTGLAFGVQWVSAYLTQALFGIPASALLNTDVDGTSSIFPDTILFTVIYSVLMVISVAPSEEVLFRGFCQKGIQDSFKNPKLGKTLALIITAVYFSLFHIYAYFVNPPLLFFTFFPYLSLSLILGFLYMWRKNLISAITAHALYNIIQFLIVILI